jgi:hypothetical protein
MTPRFTGIRVPEVEFSQTEPQIHAYFSDFGSDLQENGAFWREVCFLKAAMKLKVLQFTFTALVDLVGPA